MALNFTYIINYIFDWWLFIITIICQNLVSFYTCIFFTSPWNIRLTISKFSPLPPVFNTPPHPLPFWYLLRVHKSCLICQTYNISWMLCKSCKTVFGRIFLHNDLESISQAPPFYPQPPYSFPSWRIFCCYLIFL